MKVKITIEGQKSNNKATFKKFALILLIAEFPPFYFIYLEVKKQDIITITSTQKIKKFPYVFNHQANKSVFQKPILI